MKNLLLNILFFFPVTKIGLEFLHIFLLFKDATNTFTKCVSLFWSGMFVTRESQNKVETSQPDWLVELGISYISFVFFFSRLSSLFYITSKILIICQSWCCVCSGNNVKPSIFIAYVKFSLNSCKNHLLLSPFEYFLKWKKQTYSYIHFSCRI